MRPEAPIEAIAIGCPRIHRLRLEPYTLALRRRWASARGGFRQRHGWLLCLEADGLSGFGDCAPLPAAGTEEPAVAEAALRALGPPAHGISPERLLSCLDERPGPPAPAARCALECAVLDLASRVRGVPLRRLLAADAADDLPVNAMAGALAEVTPRELRMAEATGCRVIKLKVGLEPPDRELARLRILASNLPPGIALRLDANGAWSNGEAERMIDGLAELPIESLEEPLQVPDPDRLRALQQRANFALALDESLAERGTPEDLAELGVRRIVVKPAVAGGPVHALAQSRRAARAGIEVVVTGLVESAAGLWPTAQLAAATGSRLPHGLATADWLAEDLGYSPRPVRGHLLLPDRPGSGFEPTTRTERAPGTRT